MVVDNFQEVHKLFDNVPEGFMLTGLILIRDKDFKNGDNLIYGKKRNVKFYSFKSLDEFKAFEFQIKAICKGINARFYLYPTPISANLLAIELIRVFLNEIEKGNEYAIMEDIQENLFRSRPKSMLIDSDPFILVDLDDLDSVDAYREVLYSNIPDKIVLDLPTLNGHLFLLRNHKMTEYKDLDLYQYLKEKELIEYKPDCPVMVYYSGEFYERTE